MTAYLAERLGAHHDASSFRCGVESLDRWLLNAGVANQREGTSQTYAWVEHEGHTRVLGYFTVSPTIIEAVSLSRSQRGGAGERGTVPGYLLGKIALCEDLRGQNPPVGADLLIEALKVIVRAADIAGGRLIAVDARDEKVAKFYEDASFTPIKTSPLRLIARISTLRDALADAS